MKFFISFFALIAIPAFAFSQTTGTKAPAAVAPVVAVPTPTVDLANAPKLVCPHPNFDFHNVDEGPDIIHEFHFRNRGKTTLKITNVGTSCGCTAAVEDKKEIAPGGRGTIKATYHTSGRPGHATKIITVSSNDPVNPNFQMKLDMTVVRDVDMQPDRIYLYGVKFKQPHDSAIKILGKPGVPLTILSAESANKVVTVTSIAPVTEIVPAAAPVSGQAPSKEEKRTGATITVTLPATQPIGSFTDEIVVKTSSPKKPEVRIPVLGEVAGRIQYNPKILTFSAHQDAPVTIQFTADPPQGFQIRSVKSIKHIARPSIRKTRGPNGFDQYSLITSVVKNLPKDSDGKDQIIIETNDADQAAITIEVSALK